MLHESDYYNITRVLSYHCAWNFIIGARGLGNTYALKKLCIDDCIKRGWQFIYLRRYDTEQRTKGTFFADIAERYPGHEFRVNGNTAEYREAGDDDNRPWQVMGYFLALSQAGHVKSVAYPKVRTIFFDEIFPDSGQYLSGEVTRLEEFYSTVDRWTDRVRLIMCSNAVSLANPYFAFFRIDAKKQMNDAKQFRKYCGGYIMLELADYGGFSAKVAQSNFGRFLMKYDEEYAKYSMNNKFRDDNDALIVDDMDGAEYCFTIVTREYGTFTIWQHLDGDSVIWLVSRKRKKGDTREYTYDYRLVDGETKLLKRSDDLTKKLTEAYSVGRVRFADPQCKSEFGMLLGSLMAQSKTK